jgi:hypothetical protein
MATGPSTYTCEVETATRKTPVEVAEVVTISFSGDCGHPGLMWQLQTRRGRRRGRASEFLRLPRDRGPEASRVASVPAPNDSDVCRQTACPFRGVVWLIDVSHSLIER